MSVYAIADLHGQLPQIPEDCDTLLIAGDICPDYPPMRSAHYEMVDRNGHRQAAWLGSVFRDWIADVPNVVATWGNHDWVGEAKNLVPDLPWRLLVDAETTVERPQGPLRVWGTPWVPNLASWAFYGTDVLLDVRAEAIPSGLDVLMSHGPPLGAGDRVMRGNVGDSSIGDAIKRCRPDMTICGHIHEGRGTYSFGDGSLVLNVSAVDEFYDMRPDPFVKLYD